MSAEVTYQQALQAARKLLQQGVGSEDSRLDCEILLAYTIKKSRTFVHTHPEYSLTSDEYTVFQNLILQRQQGMPIAYIIQNRAFWSLSFKVNQHTLIPRPETELLIAVILQKLQHLPDAEILDLGTGCGTIAVTLAHEKPYWQLIATDLSFPALIIAQENASNFNCKNVRFINNDWFAAISITKKFHAIIANPPYIAETDPHLQLGDVRFEPRHALISSNDGYADLKYIINHSIGRLVKNGLLLLEHGYQQKDQVLKMLKECGYVQIDSYKDWQGNDRVSIGQV